VSAALTLARHSLRRSRALLIVMLGVLAAFEVLLVVAAGTLQESGTFGSFAALVPPFMRQMFGDSLLVFMSFAGVVCFGYFHPMIVAALAGFVIAIATEPVGEIETRFLDVVLARPLPRAAVVGRSVLLLALLPALVIGAMLAATSLSLHWLAPRGAGVPTARLIVSLGVNLWALLLCIGGVSLAVAAASRRRSTAAGLLGMAALALFLVDYLARIWKPAASVAWLSPFHYDDAMAMVMGRPLPASHIEVLVITALAGIAVAFVLFSRRDV
jgi:ABC-2 type transport system permease protein